MRSTRVILFLHCSASLVFAQAAPPQLTARELFYQAPPAKVAAKPSAATAATRPPAKRAAHTPPKPVEIARADTRPPAVAPTERPATAPMPVSGAAPLGLRYTILQLNGDAGVEVPNDTVFHAGDRIRFNIEANTPGYLYIISQGSSGTWKPMFPSAEVEDGDNHIEGRRSFTMPPNSRLAFDTTAGTENVFIVLTLKPEPDLEAMIYSLQGKKKAAAPEAPAVSSKELITAANIPNAQVDKMRSLYGRDLIIEKVDRKTQGEQKETAVYVVNPTGNADSRVVADLHLVHQ